MGTTYLHHCPPIEIDGTFRNPGKGPHTDVEVRVAYSLRHLETLVRFLGGVDLTTVSLFKKPDGWLVMLKGIGPRHPMIAWMHGATFAQALEILATSCDSSHVDWGIEGPKKPR